VPLLSTTFLTLDATNWMTNIFLSVLDIKSLFGIMTLIKTNIGLPMEGRGSLQFPNPKLERLSS
jgi:hypothetical protein